MTGKEKRDRKKMVACMEFIARQLNDEEILVDNWLSCGGLYCGGVVTR